MYLETIDRLSGAGWTTEDIDKAHVLPTDRATAESQRFERDLTLAAPPQTPDYHQKGRAGTDLDEMFCGYAGCASFGCLQHSRSSDVMIATDAVSDASLFVSHPPAPRPLTRRLRPCTCGSTGAPGHWAHDERGQLRDIGDDFAKRNLSICDLRAVFPGRTCPDIAAGIEQVFDKDAVDAKPVLPETVKLKFGALPCTRS
jgi:hypothetical protein